MIILQNTYLVINNLYGSLKGKWHYVGSNDYDKKIRLHDAHFKVYTNIETLCYTPATNIMLYVNSASI